MWSIRHQQFIVGSHLYWCYVDPWKYNFVLSALLNGNRDTCKAHSCFCVSTRSCIQPNHNWQFKALIGKIFWHRIWQIVSHGIFQACCSLTQYFDNNKYVLYCAALLKANSIWSTTFNEYEYYVVPVVTQHLKRVAAFYMGRVWGG